MSNFILFDEYLSAPAKEIIRHLKNLSSRNLASWFSQQGVKHTLEKSHCVICVSIFQKISVLDEIEEEKGISKEFLYFMQK